MKKVFASVDNDISAGVRKSFVYPDCLTLIISDKGRDEAQTAVLPNRDVPSLMLALGEAAGVVPKVTTRYLYGTPEHLALIQWHLAKYTKAQAAIAAQAEETAKLEAEALELCNVVVTSWGNPPYPSVQHMGKETLNRWIAVVRKARELGN